MENVFLSYSRADSLDFARELHRRLVRDGIACFFDEVSIEWGENFVLALEDGLDTCDHIIVVLSPGFIRSEWTTVERTSSALEGSANVKRKIMPLLHHPCEIPRFLKPIQYLDVTSDELFDKHYPNICQILGGAIPDTSRENELSEWPKSLPPIDWPIANHGDVCLTFGTLLTRTNTQRLLTVTGPSESGKSLIAQQMFGNALRIPDLACGLFNFKGTTDMDNALRAFIQNLDVPFPSAGHSLNEKLSMILEALKNKPRPTLLIFDTYESVGETKNWVEGQLLSLLVRASWLRVAIVGQQVPKYSGTIWQQSSFPTITLKNPPPDAWFKYCQRHRKDVSLAEVKTVYGIINKASVLAQAFGPQV